MNALMHYKTIYDSIRILQPDLASIFTFRRQKDTKILKKYFFAGLISKTLRRGAL